MTQLTILFTSFRIEHIKKTNLLEIEKLVREEFHYIYGERESDIHIIFGEARTEKYDVLIAYDSIPKIINAMSSRLIEFEERVAEGLKTLLPTDCRYGGKVGTCPITKVRMPETTEQKTSFAADGSSLNRSTEAAYEEMAKQFKAQKPKFTFDRLVLDAQVQQRIFEAIGVLENKDKLFEEWGLKEIMSPSVLLNLYGKSGTGKTMAAEAIASQMGKRIIRASYADIESKYHGEGPKRLKGIFEAAKQQDAVLFIDEADSMLSARLNNVSQGSEQAINSMRSQLLMSLENHEGIVIFATNLIENYDKAFLTRLICVELKRPNAAARERIWRNHLYPVEDSVSKLNIPLMDDINLKQLSKYDFCGRDIRNAVKQACITTVVQNKDIVSQKDLLEACDKIRKELEDLKTATNKEGENSHPADENEKQNLTQKLAAKILDQGSES